MSKCSQDTVQPKILVVEDDLNLREALVDTLELENFNVLSAASAEAAICILEKERDIDLVVSDVNMGAMSGHDLLQKVKADYAHIPVLLITAYASISESVRAIREGAVDYLVKPFEPKALVETVKKFVGLGGQQYEEPIATAESSRQLLQLASRVAKSESTVLLLGESGTGKEVLAKYIHDKSPRADRPFIAINCAAIPENMLEAMLFGHEKGAYTGAYNSAPGKFEQANGGTILLDEISEMDLGLQAKLLRVLQEREVERLGGRKSIKLDVRVIATSNRDMRIEVVNGKFREDLYFRLSVLPLQWAPLRDRADDILPLAERLMSRHALKQHRTGVSFSDGAKEALHSYAWPGNVRELDNVIQRALILQTGNTIQAEDLGLQPVETYSAKPSLVESMAAQTKQAIWGMANELVAKNGESAKVLSSTGANENPDMANSLGALATDTSSVIPAEENAAVDQVEDGARLGKDMRRHEFEIIVKTLRQENGSKKNTADRLGISPRTLRYKIAKLREEGYNLEAALG